MTIPQPEPLDAVATFLACGRSAGLGVAEQKRLDWMRDLLSQTAMWSTPPPELLEPITTRIQTARRRGLHAVGRPGRTIAGLARGTAMLAVVLVAPCYCRRRGTE
jgi:hypothetical protein